MKPKKIKFSSDLEYLPIPKAAHAFIPDWYKKSDKHQGGSPGLDETYASKAAVKACFPFRDALTSGYIIELPVGVEVYGDVNYEPSFKWAIGPDPIVVRNPELNPLVPIPIGCSSMHLAWKIPHVTKTPPGYSCLVTHPLNRFDLPFLTLSGVVDTDSGMQQGLIPFFIKDNFRGIIEAGTPIAQIVPFKREEWESEQDQRLLSLGEKLNFLSSRVISGGFYGKNSWKNKKYR